MTEQLDQHYCIKFYQELRYSQVETFRRIRRLLVTMLWASHRLRRGTTGLKMTAHRWPSTSRNDQVIAAEVNTVVMRDYPRNCRRDGHQHFFGTFHSDWWFDHHNAPAHDSDFLPKNQTPVIHQASYSPDMAPLWPWKGNRYQTSENIMTATTAELNTILKEPFSECFQQWWHHWKCVEYQGDYFEGY